MHGGTRVLDLYRMLLIKMKESSLSISDIARSVSIDKTFLEDHISNMRELPFDIVLKISDLFPKDGMEIMERYIEDVEETENIFLSLEYASMHVMVNASKRLIERIRSNKNKELKKNERLQEWADIYQISHEYQSGKIPKTKLLHELRGKHPHSIEMIVFKKCLELYILNVLQKFDIVLYFREEVEQNIFSINPGYIRSSFLVRFCEIYYVAAFRRPDSLDLARFYANKIIDEATSFGYRVHAFNTIGLSYIFDDYDLALSYIQKARDLFKKRESECGSALRLIESNMMFLKNVWNRHDDVPDTHDQSEIAHYLIKNGKGKEGLEILDKIEPTAFRLFYRWLATDNKEDLYSAVEKFRQNKDFFFLEKLALPALISTGIDPKLASLLCS